MPEVRKTAGAKSNDNAMTVLFGKFNSNKLGTVTRSLSIGESHLLWLKK